jgi:hypothetical protein
VGGHGHNDPLALELRLDGGPLVVDPGTWSYLGDPAGRDRFRGVAMHSTLQVDGREPSPLLPGRPFALPDRAHAELRELWRGPGFDAAAGRHLGHPGLEHRRALALGESAAWVLDDLQGEGDHAVVSRFHLPDAEARLRALTEDERARLGELPFAADWDVEHAVELGPPDAPRALWVAPRGGRIALIPSAYSPGYDRQVPAVCIEVALRAELPVRLAAAFLFIRPQVACGEHPSEEAAQSCAS